MKKSLAHLPKHKREELKLVTEIILDECPTVLMVILFGSYARGDWGSRGHHIEQVADRARRPYLSALPPSNRSSELVGIAFLD
jgi:hypothetical protein